MKKPTLAVSGINDKAGAHTPVRASGPAGAGRGGAARQGRAACGRAHRLDVLGLVVEQLAQLHGHQVLRAASAPFRVCQSVRRQRSRLLPASPALPLPGCPGPRPRSALPGCACAGRAPELPGGVGGAGLAPVARAEGIPGAPFLSRAPVRPRAGRSPRVRSPGAATAALPVRSRARWKSLRGSPSALRRRRRCGGCGSPRPTGALTFNLRSEASGAPGARGGRALYPPAAFREHSFFSLFHSTHA